MKKIDPQRMYEILNKDRLRYWHFLRELAIMSLPPQDRHEYKGPFANDHEYEGPFANDSETCFALISHWCSGTNISFTNYDSTFVDEMLQNYPKQKTYYRLWFYPMPGEQMPVDTIHGLSLNPQGSLFAYTGEVPTAPIDPHIRILEKDEIDMLEPYLPYDGESYGSYISTCMSETKKKDGKAFAWRDEQNLIRAFAFCIPRFEEFWDFGPYHFSKELKYRTPEIVAALLYAYLKTIREQEDIPTTQLNLKEAHEAGFTLQRNRCLFD